MKFKVTSFIALILLMLITGVFWGTWFTLTRSIDSFSPSEFMHIGQVIIANVAMPMRIIMPCGILFMGLTLWFADNKRSGGFYIGVTSLALIVGILLITLIVLVPIDNEIKTWTMATVPSDWEAKRDTWAVFHAIRTGLSVISFASFTLFSLAE
jgi:hypothetical protein